MNIFEYLQKYDYEQLIFCHDAASGLKAIICIHDTTLGPALAGAACGPTRRRKMPSLTRCVSPAG